MSRTPLWWQLCYPMALAVAESLKRDLGMVREWSDSCRMKLNASKTKSMIVAMSGLVMHAPLLNYWTSQWGQFYNCGCISLWHCTSSICDSIMYAVSGVTRCTLFMVLYLCLMRQCGLHAVLWSHIGILISLLSPEPRSTEGVSVSLRNDLFWDWRVLR